jgi:hypothetical protein
MKISPFRTSCRKDLKSQIFITARSSTCGRNIKKKQLPVRQDKLKNENTDSTLDSHYERIWLKMNEEYEINLNKHGNSKNLA